VIAAGGISGWGWVAFAGFAALLCLVGYGVVRVSRRPQHLADLSLDDPIRIPLWRAKAAWRLAVVFGLLCAAVSSVANHGNATSWVFVAVILVLAAGTASAARDALRGQPAVVLDREGLYEGGSGRHVRWSDVRVARVNVRQGAFDEYHDLVVEVRTGEPPLEIQLDELAMDWREVMQLVGELSAQPTQVHRRQGILRTSR
jgi:hypothetical protein